MSFIESRDYANFFFSDHHLIPDRDDPSLSEF